MLTTLWMAAFALDLMVASHRRPYAGLLAASRTFGGFTDFFSTWLLYSRRRSAIFSCENRNFLIDSHSTSALRVKHVFPAEIMAQSWQPNSRNLDPVRDEIRPSGPR